MQPLKMIEVDYPEPHFDRTQRLLKTHPEVKKLFGYTPSTSLYVLFLVALQISLAFMLGHSSFWLILLSAYGVGAFANHGLFVLIHECTHNLVFRGNSTNSLLQIFANLPIIFPSSISFRILHLKHHLYQGDLERDGDLPRLFEVRFAGNSAFKKAVWYLCYFLPQAIRIFYMKKIPLLTGWVALNWVVELSFLAALTYLSGWGALAYLGLSTIFSIGLHPVGARWIQEHFVLFEKQETYSYYGPLNKVAFNVGYHNEHHDFMTIPWSRLPQVRAMMPEAYNTLYYHMSWTGLLLQFIFDPNLGLFSRVIRPADVASRSKKHKKSSLAPEVAGGELQPSVHLASHPIFAAQEDTMSVISAATALA